MAFQLISGRSFSGKVSGKDRNVFEYLLEWEAWSNTYCSPILIAPNTYCSLRHCLVAIGIAIPIAIGIHQIEGGGGYVFHNRYCNTYCNRYCNRYSNIYWSGMYGAIPIAPNTYCSQYILLPIPIAPNTYCSQYLLLTNTYCSQRHIAWWQ